MGVIGFAGLSHLGVVSSAAAAAKGFEVVAYDPDRALVEELAAGRSRISEPGLAELLARPSPGRLRFESSARALEACEIIYVSRDVPTADDGSSDLSGVVSLVAEVARAAAPRTAIVILSQVRPGFTRSLLPALATHEKGLTLHYQVETLIFGRAVERALSPERFIVGCREPSEPLPPALAAHLTAFGCPVMPMRYESAELCKISINAFLVSSISTANMLAEIAGAIGAEWREIVPALRLDARIGPRAYLTPGLGVAGGNLERDLATIRSLAADHGARAALVTAWIEDSRYRRDWALREIRSRLPSGVEGSRLALWGLAYKEDTHSTRGSPALHLARALHPMPIRAYDPAADIGHEAGLDHLERCATALEACRDADVLAVMTPWPELARVDLAAARELMRGRLVVDPFGVLDAGRAGAVGLEHLRIGTPAPDGTRRRA